jgi:FkbM family methyltransferase
LRQLKKFTRANSNVSSFAVYICDMINYIKRKLTKLKAQTIFKEYGAELKTFNLPGYGKVEYFQWTNPLEKQKIVTQEKVDFFKKFLKPGSFAIDIGAHTGDTTLPMGLVTGASGKVLALDPNPYIFKLLKKNCELNKEKTNIEPLNCAATVEDGDFYYHSSEASFNNGAISALPNSKSGGFQMKDKVKGINLTKYLEMNLSEWLPKLALIKVDTEGYDKDVLNSLGTVIAKYRPSIIMECFYKLTAKQRTELFDSVARHRYQLFHFDDFLSTTPVTEVLTPSDMMRWKHFDIYCTSETN